MNLRALLATGLAVILLGLLLGLIPGSTKDTSCGSPWVRDTTAIESANFGSEMAADLISGYGGPRFTATDYGQMCSDALGARGVWGGALTSLGVLTLLGVALVSAQRSSDPVSG